MAGEEVIEIMDAEVSVASIVRQMGLEDLAHHLGGKISTTAWLKEVRNRVSFVCSCFYFSVFPLDFIPVFEHKLILM